MLSLGLKTVACAACCLTCAIVVIGDESTDPSVVSLLEKCAMREGIQATDIPVMHGAGVTTELYKQSGMTTTKRVTFYVNTDRFLAIQDYEQSDNKGGYSAAVLVTPDFELRLNKPAGSTTWNISHFGNGSKISELRQKRWRALSGQWLGLLPTPIASGNFAIAQSLSSSAKTKRFTAEKQLLDGHEAHVFITNEPDAQDPSVIHVGKFYFDATEELLFLGQDVVSPAGPEWGITMRNHYVKDAPVPLREYNLFDTPFRKTTWTLEYIEFSPTDEDEFSSARFGLGDLAVTPENHKASLWWLLAIIALAAFLMGWVLRRHAKRIASSKA